jgi:hypothetical protein
MEGFGVEEGGEALGIKDIGRCKGTGVEAG